MKNFFKYYFLKLFVVNANFLGLFRLVGLLLWIVYSLSLIVLVMIHIESLSFNNYSVFFMLECIYPVMLGFTFFVIPLTRDVSKLETVKIGNTQINLGGE